MRPIFSLNGNKKSYSIKPWGQSINHLQSEFNNCVLTDWRGWGKFEDFLEWNQSNHLLNHGWVDTKLKRGPTRVSFLCRESRLSTSSNRTVIWDSRLTLKRICKVNFSYSSLLFKKIDLKIFSIPQKLLFVSFQLKQCFRDHSA